MYLFTKVRYFNFTLSLKRIFPRDVFTHVLFGTYHLEWAKEKKTHQQSDEELNENLKVFYAEVRNQKGEDYGKSTLLCLRNGIERHLNFPLHNRGIKFSQNTTFRSSNMMLNAKIRDLTLFVPGLFVVKYPGGVLIGRTPQKFCKIVVMVLFWGFFINFMILLSKNSKINLLHIQIVTFLLH